MFCKNCGNRFANQHALWGHKSHCSQVEMKTKSKVEQSREWDNEGVFLEDNTAAVNNAKELEAHENTAVDNDAEEWEDEFLIDRDNEHRQRSHIWNEEYLELQRNVLKAQTVKLVKAGFSKSLGGKRSNERGHPQNKMEICQYVEGEGITTGGGDRLLHMMKRCTKRSKREIAIGSDYKYLKNSLLKPFKSRFKKWYIL
jgi:hypothetical protein